MVEVEKISKKVKPILKKHLVRRAAIFGSFARGEAKKNSDIDLLIEPPKKMTLFGLAGLKFDLEDKLGRKVDIVTYKSLYPRLKYYVEKDLQAIL